MTIYLYVKTHRKTGLKYLGKTEQDPHMYKGSGVHWLRHLKKHGNDVETIILHKCSSKTEIREIGIFYSKLWDIVKSDQWANLKEESGDGYSSDDVKKLWENPNHQQMMSNMLKTKWEDPEFSQNQRILSSSRLKEKWTDETYRKEMCEVIKTRSSNPEFRKSQSEKCRKVWDNPEYRNQHSGRNSSAYDHNLYHFIHTNGTEEYCTRHDLQLKYNLSQPKLSLLINGKRNHHGGWKIVR